MYAIDLGKGGKNERMRKSEHSSRRTESDVRSNVQDSSTKDVDMITTKMAKYTISTPRASNSILQVIVEEPSNTLSM